MAARGGGRGGAAAEQLPLGAVRTEDGQVVIPASTRADGSTRKAIRIRQGYVPQDEIAAYKTPAQRVHTLPSPMQGLRSFSRSTNLLSAFVAAGRGTAATYREAAGGRR